MPKADPTIVPASCKVKNLSPQLRYYYRNLERCRSEANTRGKKSRADNPEEEYAKDRAYFLANKERIREQSRIRDSKNRDAINAKQRAYNAKNPERILAIARANNHKRREWMVESGNPPSSKDILDLLARARRCHYCNRSFGTKLLKTIDHITPRTKGGKHELANLVVACRNCNSSKSDLAPHEYAQRIGLLLI